MLRQLQLCENKGERWSACQDFHSRSYPVGGSRRGGQLPIPSGSNHDALVSRSALVLFLLDQLSVLLPIPFRASIPSLATTTRHRKNDMTSLCPGRGAATTWCLGACQATMGGSELRG